MRIHWTDADPMDVHELKVVIRLITTGKLPTETRIDRAELATILGCKHKGAPCVACLEQLN